MKKRTDIGRTAPKDALERSVGGRESFTEVLSGVNRDTKQEILFRLLCDPARVKDSLGMLCRAAGVQSSEVLTVFRESAVAGALVRAQVALSGRLEAVVNDVADKAQNHWEPCECLAPKGPKKALTAVDDCNICSGTGKLWFRGNIKYADLVFETMGLTSRKGSGVNVQVNQGVQIGAQGGFLDKFVAATDESAFDVMEGETDAQIPEEAGSH